MQRSALCRSRRELSNEAVIAKFGVDTAENKPSKVWPAFSFLPRTPPWVKQTAMATFHTLRLLFSRHFPWISVTESTRLWVSIWSGMSANELEPRPNTNQRISILGETTKNLALEKFTNVTLRWNRNLEDHPQEVQSDSRLPTGKQALYSSWGAERGFRMICI